MKPKNPITLYLVFTLIFSTIVWLLTLNATSAGRIAGRIYGYGIMWCPALATLVTCSLTGRKISGLSWKWGKPKYLIASYLIPMVYSIITYVIIWTAGWGGFYDKAFVAKTAHELGWDGLPNWVFIPVFFVVNGVVGMFASMSTALGEEIGWRGFLVPELSKKMGYAGVSLSSGLIWAVWHYPLLIFGNYNNGTPTWYGMLCFTVSITSASFIYTWYRMRSGSLWTGVLLHASHNLFIQTFFTPITLQNIRSRWYIDEFGAVVPTVSLILALFFWSRNKALDVKHYSRR